MRHIKLLGFMLLTIFAASAITTSVASAENPEILPKGTVTYTFTSGKGRLETTAGRIIECATDEGKGSFTTQDEGPLTVDFKECKEPKSGAKCNSAGDAAGTILLAENETTGHLVTFLKEAVLTLGFEVVIAEKEKDLKITCGVVKINVLKDVIGVVDGVKTLVKFSKFKILFHQTKGEQEIKTCELLKAFCKPELFLGADFGSGEELAGLESEEEATFKPEIEIHF